MKIKDFKVFDETQEDYVVLKGRIIVDNLYFAGYVEDSVEDEKKFIVGEYTDEAAKEGLTVTLRDIPFSIALSEPKEKISDVLNEMKEFSNKNAQGDSKMFYADCRDSEVELYYDSELISTNLLVK